MTTLKTKEHQARHWVFTWNNPPLNWKQQCDQVAGISCEHFAFQLEKGELGTQHVQGYFGFGGKGLRLSACKLLLDPKVHWEQAKAPHKAWLYCQKEDTRQAAGSDCGCAPAAPTDGLKQNRWQTFRDFAGEHTWLECFDSFPDLVPRQGAMRAIYERKLTLDHDCEKKITVIYGESGVGKSYTAKKMLEGKKYFRKDCTNKWWDGYSYEDIVWLDDMQPKSGFSRSSFLQLLDRGVVQAEVKGGITTIVATTIVITSNYKPEEWFEKSEAVMRRVNYLYEVKAGGKVSEVRQRQGNTVPAVAQKVQRSIFEMMQKEDESGIVLGADDESTEEYVDDEEMIKRNDEEDWKKKEEQIRKFASMVDKRMEYFSEDESGDNKRRIIEPEEGVIYTASILKRQNAQLPLDIF